MSEANELEIYVELEKVKQQRDEALEACKLLVGWYEKGADRGEGVYGELGRAVDLAIAAVAKTEDDTA